MPEWLDLSLRLEGNELFLLLVPVTGSLVYYIYRRTYPALAQKARLGLTVVRALVVSLLCLILGEPILGLWSKAVLRPAILLVIDTSPSMAINRRFEQLITILEDEEFNSALEEVDVQSWGFAHEAYPLALDTLAAIQLGGKATNLSRALNKGFEQSAAPDLLEGVLILSDGAHNLGMDPVRLVQDLDVPLYALGIGGEESLADIQIVGAATEETGYIGQQQAIEGKLRHWGFADTEVEVRLYEGMEEIARQYISLSQDALEQHFSFAVVPTRPGPHIYRLQVEAQAGEVARDNNEALVFTHIAKERIQILLVASSPSPDLAFIRRSLETDPHMEVSVAVQQDEETFYTGISLVEDQLQRRDVVILLDPDGKLMEGREGETIVENVLAGAGLLFIGGPKAFDDWNSQTAIAQALPLYIETDGKALTARDVSLQSSQEGKRHPIVRLPVGGVDPWAALPPLPGYVVAARKRPGAMSLVESGDAARVPLIAVHAYGQGKVLAALATGFWRLDLLSSGVDGRSQTIREFWRNAVKWLALRAPVGRVRVSTEQHIYRAGEEVRFSAQVFDELLRPQPAARVQISLNGREFQLQDRGDGHYRGGWTGLESGEYTYTAQAWIDNNVIGADTGNFIIEQYSVESLDMRSNNALLEKLAHVSGGQFRPLEQWRELLQALPLQKRLIEENHVFPLWGQRWLLAIVVALLATEWFVRKRKGLI
jgi:hypothetical protein